MSPYTCTSALRLSHIVHMTFLFHLCYFLTSIHQSHCRSNSHSLFLSSNLAPFLSFSYLPTLLVTCCIFGRTFILGHEAHTQYTRAVFLLHILSLTQLSLPAVNQPAGKPSSGVLYVHVNYNLFIVKKGIF